jgi:hypothetical protein
VLHDAQNKDTLSAVVTSRDQPVLVASDVEDRAAANLIGAPEIAPQLRKIAPAGFSCGREPVRQRGNVIGMQFAISHELPSY